MRARVAQGEGFADGVADAFVGARDEGELLGHFCFLFLALGSGSLGRMRHYAR